MTIEPLGELHFKEMSQSVGAKFEMLENKDNRNLKLIALTLVTEEGERYLTEADFPAMEAMPFTVINAVLFEALEINGFLKEGATKEDLAKEPDLLQKDSEDFEEKFVA